MTKKKPDPLVNLLEQYKSSDMTAGEMAQLVRGLSRLQPEFFFGTSATTQNKGKGRQRADASNIDLKNG